MTTDMNPADPETWTSRGRRPEHATVIANAWRDFPDLPFSASMEERTARTRARTEAMRPVFAAMDRAMEAERQATNFAFVERQLSAGKGTDQDIATLRGRDQYGFGWDAAIQYAQGWYAAHAGWPHRRPSCDRTGATNEASARAYDRGFTDGGGCPDDLFDAAKRANLAALRRDNQLGEQHVARAARPTPSSWGRPTDEKRPVAWARRLLLIADCPAQHSVDQSPAVELFDGKPFRLLRSHPGHASMTIVIMSAEHGFIDARTPIAPYDRTMTAERAAAIIADPGERAKLARLVNETAFEDILVVATGHHLAVVDAHAQALPLCPNMERTGDQLAVHEGHLRTWLARGMVPGENRAAGHIRWGKIHQGLRGSLGEFTARYAEKSAERRAHGIVIELADGSEAIGFTTASGQALEPRRIITNKAHLRETMTDMLRTFAAATRL